MYNKKTFDRYQPKERFRINDYIRVSSVLLIKDEQKLGVIAIDEAKRMAREAGLDLVEIAPTAKPPVCKIMDYKKFKYELAVKEKEAKKKQKTTQLKELRLSPSIAEHDFQIKINNAKRFLEEGHSVQFKLKFKNREKAHKDVGFVVINKIITELTELGDVKTQPRYEGDSINCIIDPKKK